MLTYVFEESDLPLYEQVYKHIKEDILSGRLKAGEKLPSKRSFAENNGISTITIINAYEQLISEGYIYSVPKKGYFVSDISFFRKEKKNENISLDIKLPKEQPAYQVNLSSNVMDPESFPFSVWAKLLREIMAEKSSKLMETAPTGGVYALRKAIADHLQSFRGMLVDPDQIVVGAGTEYLYGLLVQLLGNDKSYCIENPGYKKPEKIYRQHGISCCFAQIDQKGVMIEELERADADVIHISPNHHFPTGITMPADRRYEVLSWACERTDRYIIEDDYDSEFRTNGKPLPTLFSMDHNGKVVYMNTFSKSLTPTIRISYMILPVELANRFYEKLSFYSCTVSNFEQYTLAAFIARGYFEKHINRMRLYYARQRKAVIESLQKSRLKDYCEVEENQSGLHFLLTLKTERPDEEIMQRLEAEGIYMKAVKEYYRDEKTAGDHSFIVNYSNLDLKKLPFVYDRICEICLETGDE